MKMELVETTIDSIIVRPSIRTNVGDLTTLENSIRRIGLLFPVLINTQNVLVSGARRLQACRNLGMTRIYALKIDVEDGLMNAADIQCDENLCRLPLSFEELEKSIGVKKSLQKRGEGLLTRFKSFAKWMRIPGKGKR